MRSPSTNMLMKCLPSFLELLVSPATLALFTLVHTTIVAECQTFDELKQLPAYQKLSDPNKGKGLNRGDVGATNVNAQTNFGSLWTSPRNAANLLLWLQAKIPGYKYTETIVGLNREHVGAQALLYNKNFVRVRVDVLVPRVEYSTMAQYNTLQSFNQFRPPTLDVIADQIIPIQGMEANYYRTNKGECSLLLKIERLGIVNLAVEKCSDSKVMMDVAKQLNFARLNQKLLS
jgi:hypothetical protein